MAYLRCTQCGSKALVAASQCPRCAHPFQLHDARGARVKLRSCRGCGIMHRVDSACHWCGELKQPAALEMITSRRAAAAAIAALVGIGVWQAGPAMRSLRTGIVQERAVDAAQSAAIVQPLAVAAAIGRAAMPAPAATDAVAVPDSAVQQANTRAGDSIATTAAIVADGIVWTPAVARTWVNVRSDASRVGQVVGVIRPASRAMLGTDRAGWRQVRSPEVSGWVDPRLFEPDSANTRGQ